jgi:hypothetical protein
MILCTHHWSHSRLNELRRVLVFSTYGRVTFEKSEHLVSTVPVSFPQEAYFLGSHSNPTLSRYTVSGKLLGDDIEARNQIQNDRYHNKCVTVRIKITLCSLSLRYTTRVRLLSWYILSEIALAHNHNVL